MYIVFVFLCHTPHEYVVCPQEVDEQFFLVFPDSFVILAVGMSLSGYEMKVHLQLCQLSEHYVFWHTQCSQWSNVLRVITNYGAISK